MEQVVVILTCYNRKEKTMQCIRSLAEQNANCGFTFVVVDDGSTDGTKELMESNAERYHIHLLRGDGSLYYCGGMRKGMEHVLHTLQTSFDYMLMVNDDVDFAPKCIEALITQSREQENSVVVGATKNDQGQLSYGAIKYLQGTKYKTMTLEEREVPADTFNANCVLIPYPVFQTVGAIDARYVHSMGDFDYGFSIKRAGYVIYPSGIHVGKCNGNPNSGTWQDTALPRMERLRKKESHKGLPAKQWFYFLNKNFGIYQAIRGSITPYLRILLGK